MNSAAARHWGSDSPIVGEVRVMITNFFYGSAPDLDNMAKPILDALEGVVYVNDFQVSDLICRNRNRNGDPRIPSPSQTMLDRLGDPKPFVHIFVDDALN